MRRTGCTWMSLALTALVLSFLAPTAMAAHEGHDASAPSALDPLKKLEGEWVGKAGASGGPMGETSVTYRVTAAGSAVIETQFPGSNHEMVTVYTVEGGQLALTHYCAAGNQPRMKQRKGTAANELVFDYTGGPGINVKADMHMHAAKMTFVDDDHIRCEWTAYEKGKVGHVMTFELERK
jgi:hypothetical protein